MSPATASYSGPNETRDALLDAAKRVIQRAGAGHLTLEAVAKEAGVSKGGLLYHFPNKQALLQGMMMTGIRYHMDEMASAVGPNAPKGEFARWYLRQAIIGPDTSCKPPMELVWSMVGAAANDPTLLQPAREMHAFSQTKLDEDLEDKDVATMLRLIGHGLWSAELFGFRVPDASQRERILAKLQSWAGLDEDETRAGTVAVQAKEGEQEVKRG